MEAKEDISDTDSGIILHSGLDSPITVTKDVSTHTRAVKLKRQSLQDRLELCILELKTLCIREAELTGHLCSDYPVLPGEKPPQIRKRIGAAFKLNEQSILHEDSELCSVEAKLSLQRQIYIAAHRLCHEEHLSKAVKKSRVQQCKREEQKLKELQDSVFQLRLEHSHSSPRPSIITQKYHGTSENSSLSDSAVPDEEELMSQSSHASFEPPPISELHTLAPGPSHLSLNSSGPLHNSPEPSPSPHQPPVKYLHPCHSPLLEYDPAPIQNSPWKESSLDQPYQKQKKSHSSSASTSPAVTPAFPPLETCLEEIDLKLQIPKHTALRHTQSSSTSSTPEMHLRRVLSLRVPISETPNNAERERGPSRGPRRRLTNGILMTPEYSPTILAMGNPVHHSSSEDSNSEHSSAPSYKSLSCQELLAEPEHLCHTQHRYHYTKHISQSYYYKNSSAQLSPRLYRGYINEVRGYDMDLSRMYIRHHASPCISSQYKHWYEEAPLYQQESRLIPHHLKLSRAPSLKEYPQHSSRALPRQVVSDELKSWHQRCQLQPQSLDRQGIQNLPLHESPRSHQHNFYDQVPQRTIDRTPVKWYKEDDQEIVSQV